MDPLSRAEWHPTQDRAEVDRTMRPIPDTPALEVYMLGLVDFAELQLLQRRIVYERGDRGGAGLILCEHPPTISIGRSGSRAHIAADDEALASMGIRTYYVNRGGGCILHVPGQLAAYLIMPLDARGLSVQGYLDRLHATIQDVLGEFDVSGSSRPDLAGVFSGPARIATVGIAVNRWIAYHGLTLNVGPYLELFDLIEEPGIGPAPLRQTSMESRRQRATPMSKVREALIRKVEGAFGLEHHHLYTHHPQVRRKVLTHAYAPSPG
jgi:lipoyl(octanoyl) transferase